MTTGFISGVFLFFLPSMNSKLFNNVVSFKHLINDCGVTSPPGALVHRSRLQGYEKWRKSQSHWQDATGLCPHWLFLTRIIPQHIMVVKKNDVSWIICCRVIQGRGFRIRFSFLFILEVFLRVNCFLHFSFSLSDLWIAGRHLVTL